METNIKTQKMNDDKLDKIVEGLEEVKISIAKINTKLETVPTNPPCAWHAGRLTEVEAKVKENNMAQTTQVLRVEGRVDTLSRLVYIGLGILLACQFVVMAYCTRFSGGSSTSSSAPAVVQTTNHLYGFLTK